MIIMSETYKSLECTRIKHLQSVELGLIKNEQQQINKFCEESGT